MVMATATTFYMPLSLAILLESSATALTIQGLLENDGWCEDNYLEREVLLGRQTRIETLRHFARRF
jgi:hypothetical protein